VLNLNKIVDFSQVKYYLLKNSLAVKRGATLFKMESVKKSCEIKGADKKWL